MVEHCCEMMRYHVEYTCDQHPDRSDCPDCLVNYDELRNTYGLIVLNEAGGGTVWITFCPWCGTKLPESSLDNDPSEPILQLFKVECRTAEGIHIFFVPAPSPDDAIVRAMTSAREAQSQEPDLTDPFQEVGSEVRVGSFEAPGSQNIIFGDWSRLPD